MQYEYVVSAHKAGSVTASATGTFTSPHEQNLILAKGSHLEIYRYTADGLKLITDAAMYGQLTVVKYLHPLGRLTGMLFVLSAKNQFAILSWDPATQCIKTESSGEIIERTGRPTTESTLIAIDPYCRFIAAYSYQGIVHLFKMVTGDQIHRLSSSAAPGGNGSSDTGVQSNSKWPYTVRDELVGGVYIPHYLKPGYLSNSDPGASIGNGQRDDTIGKKGKDSAGSEKKGKAAAHPVRSGDLYLATAQYIHELKVLDIQFLRTGKSKAAHIAVLHEDATTNRLLRVYKVDDNSGELKLLAVWLSEPFERAAWRIVPLPNGASLVIGDESIAAVSFDRPGPPVSLSTRASAVTAWEWIDRDKSERLLISDDEGVLSLIVLTYSQGNSMSNRRVAEMYVERLGATSIASCLSYLADGCVYIGSHFGDQQLIRLHTDPLNPEQLKEAHASMLDPWSYPEEENKGGSVLGKFKKLGGIVMSSESKQNENDMKPNTLIEPLATFQNLAPIVDICVMASSGEQKQQQKSSDQSQDVPMSQASVQDDIQLDSQISNGWSGGGRAADVGDTTRASASSSSQPHGTIITCSGLRNKPSLRIVRNGVGVGVLSDIKVEGVRGVWSYSINGSSVAGESNEMDVDGEGTLDKYTSRLVVVVLSLMNQTRILGWHEPATTASVADNNNNIVEVSEIELSSSQGQQGWRNQEPTIATALSNNNQYVIQITPHSVILIDTRTWSQISEWVVDRSLGGPISAASIYGDQIAVVAGGHIVVYLEISDSKIAYVAQRSMDHDISCIDIHSWEEENKMTPSKFVAVGLWKINDISILRIPDLAIAPGTVPSLYMNIGIWPSVPTIGTDSIKTKGGENPGTNNMHNQMPKSDLPRSILMASLGKTKYLIVGLGDGQLHHFAIQTSSNNADKMPPTSDEESSYLRVLEHKNVLLGSRPINLVPFTNHGIMNVFVACDHSVVLHANKQQSRIIQVNNDSSSILQQQQQQQSYSKLVYANVDTQDVMLASALDSRLFPDSLCLASSTQISIGIMDPVQKLHTRTIPLPAWASPHRIAYHPADATFGLATIHVAEAPCLPLDRWKKLGPYFEHNQSARMLVNVQSHFHSSPPQEIGKFSIINSQSMETLASVMLRPYEIPESLCVTTLHPLDRFAEQSVVNENGSNLDTLLSTTSANCSGGSFPEQSISVYALGTSIVLPNEDDAKQGRIILFQWDNVQQRIKVVGDIITLGTVYALHAFKGMLLAAVNNRVLLLGWQRREKRLDISKINDDQEAGSSFVYTQNPEFGFSLLYSQQTQIASLSIAVYNDYIAIGDIMSSASLYKYEEVVIDSQSSAANGNEPSSAAAVQQGPFAGTSVGQVASQPSSNSVATSGGSSTPIVANATKRVLHRLIPVSRDYAGAWTTAVAPVSQPVLTNCEAGTLYPEIIPDEIRIGGRAQIKDYVHAFRSPNVERFLVSDANSNIFRVSRMEDANEMAVIDQQRQHLLLQQQQHQQAARHNSNTVNASLSSFVDDLSMDQRLYIEGRWHLGDTINCLRTGSLVMDIPDPEFPDYFRPTLVYGTIQGAIGVVANVENGKCGRILDRLQVNLSQLLPTPGNWSYQRWRTYESEQRTSRPFGFLDGDLIERFLDLSLEMQRIIVKGGGLLVGEGELEAAEWKLKSEYANGYLRIEAESDVAVLSQFAVSDIEKREGVSVEYVVRLVESLARLH